MVLSVAESRLSFTPFPNLTSGTGLMKAINCHMDLSVLADWINKLSNWDYFYCAKNATHDS